MGAGASATASAPSESTGTRRDSRNTRNTNDSLSSVVRGFEAQFPDDPVAVSTRVRGELSLLSVLRDPMLQRSFGRWLEQSSGKSLLQFWIDCDNYNNLPGGDVKVLRPHALAIYEMEVVFCYRTSLQTVGIELDRDVCDIIATELSERSGGGADITALPDPERLHTMFDMVMQATFETLQFDHLPGFLAGRSVGLLPARSFDTEPENVGKGGDDRTGSEVDQEDMDSDISMEITTRCVSDGKVTVTNAFLENPNVVFHFKRYLASLPTAERESGGPKSGKHLECLEEIRDFQHAPTLEHRRKRWAIIQRRYCGKGGIDVPSLEVLRMRALGKDESQTYPAACMLDDVYEDIVEIIMTRHLVNYKSSVHSKHLEESWALDRADSLPSRTFDTEVFRRASSFSPSRGSVAAPDNRTRAKLHPPESPHVSKRRSDGDTPPSQHPSQSTPPEPHDTPSDRGEPSSEACRKSSTTGLPWGSQSLRESGLASIQAGLSPRARPPEGECRDGARKTAAAAAANVAANATDVRPSGGGEGGTGPPAALCGRNFLNDRQEWDEPNISAIGTEVAGAHSPRQHDRIGFQALLDDPLGLSLFRRHSHELFQEENINLWAEINDFKRGKYAVSRLGRALDVGESDSMSALQARRARMIFDSYISDTADTQVNLSFALRETVRHDIEELERAETEAHEGYCDVFDAIQREVFQLMELNLWTTFTQSKRYEFFSSKYSSHQARRRANEIARSLADVHAGARVRFNSTEEKDCTMRTSAIIGGRSNHDGDRHMTRGSPTGDTATTASLAPPHRIRLLTRRVGALVNKGLGGKQHDQSTAKGDHAISLSGTLSAVTPGRTISLVSSAKIALSAWASSARKAEHSCHLPKAHAKDNEGQQVE